jgi:hypothetical protein
MSADAAKREYSVSSVTALSAGCPKSTDAAKREYSSSANAADAVFATFQ